MDTDFFRFLGHKPPFHPCNPCNPCNPCPVMTAIDRKSGFTYSIGIYCSAYPYTQPQRAISSVVPRRRHVYLWGGKQLPV